MNPVTPFLNRPYLITGAAQGIGLATAKQLLSKGAKVALIDTDEYALAKVRCELHRAHKDVMAFKLDIRSSADVVRAVANTEKSLGPIEGLVNCAAILRPVRLVECSDDDWLATMTTNLKGTFNLCRAVAPLMMDRRRGAIVNITSNAATTPRIGMGPYGASKAAIEQMTRTLGLELAEYGVRCNNLAPGSTDTSMQRQLWPTHQMPQSVLEGDLQEYRLGIPLKKIATPDDIARVALFLLSDEAGHITMETIKVDGGATLGI